MNYLPGYPGMLPVHSALEIAVFVALTLLFAALGRFVRGVTTGGAVAGGVVCFGLLWAAGFSAFAALLTVFLLTWIATRLGYSRKQRLGTAEARTGRDALQVLANLGTAAACSLLYSAVSPDRRLLIAMAAALAEAAADTVSSEIGQAVGGEPRLITSGQKVAHGTNGAITAAGTLAGAMAAVVVASVFVLVNIFGWRSFAVCVAAGVAGMIFDSLLGATLERRHLLGNNAVNFVSTVIAAGLGFLLS